MPSKLDKHGDTIEQLLTEGYSANELAARFTVARSTMQSFINKNFPPRPKAGEFKDDQLPQLPGYDTEIPIIYRDYSHLEALHMYPIGDIHYGAPTCAADVLTEWVDYIVDTPGTSVLNTGDNFNVAIEGSKSDIYKEKLRMGEARPQFTEIFRPLATSGKLDAIIDGNHEARYYRATGDSPNQMVAEALDVPYAPAAALVVYKVGDYEYEVYLRHGNGGGASMGAAVNRLEKQERVIDADVYITGHTHTQVAFPKNTFVRTGDTIVRKKRLFVSSGSFLSYEDYAAVAGYPPAHIGAPRIFMDGRRHDLHASV